MLIIVWNCFIVDFKLLYISKFGRDSRQLQLCKYVQRLSDISVNTMFS